MLYYVNVCFFKHMHANRFILLIFFLLQIINLQAQDITGGWKGTISLNGADIEFIFKISKMDDSLLSTLDVPKQGLSGFKAKHTKFDDSRLIMEFPEFNMKYTGTLDSGGLISGHIFQNNKKEALNLIRGELIINRPQHPVGKLSYSSEDLTFQTSEGLVLQGTLTYPFNDEFPVVILVTGSGPQNRDSEMFGHKPNLVIADHLTKNGIAVLRFDERGAGKSEGDFSKSTIDTQSEDVKSAIKYLRSRNNKITSLGLIGHSIGGIVSAKVASETNDVDFMVLLASPGVDGDKLMLKQKADIEKSMGLNDVQVEQGQKFVKGAYDIIRNSGLNNETLTDSLLSFYLKEYGDVVPKVAREQLVNTLVSSELLSLIRSSPSQFFKRVKCPTLALNGMKDLQVSANENLEAIRVALEAGGNQQIKVVSLEGLNHLFQEAKTGSVSEYSTIEETISPYVLRLLSDWLLSITK